MSNTMQGTRRYPSGKDTAGAFPGDYWFDDRDNKWKCLTPNGLWGNLGGHEVVEHDDGTISVTPSILVTHHSDGEWHGYLECGVWRVV